MKFTLQDKFGRLQELWIHDPRKPVLVDEEGRPALCLEDLGFPQVPSRGRSTADWKHVTDALLCRPTTGIYVDWIESKSQPVRETFYEMYLEALYLLTGKLLIQVSK